MNALAHNHVMGPTWAGSLLEGAELGSVGYGSCYAVTQDQETVNEDQLIVRC